MEALFEFPTRVADSRVTIFFGKHMAVRNVFLNKFFVGMHKTKTYKDPFSPKDESPVRLVEGDDVKFRADGVKLFSLHT